MNKKAFSLIEFLLTLALISVLVGAATPVFNSLFIGNTARSEVERVEDTLRKAQSFSISQKRDSSWGVYVDTNSTTLYSGDSFVARDTSYDESTIFSTISSASTQDISFDPQTGRTSATNQLTFTTSDNDIFLLTIFPSGIIE